MTDLLDQLRTARRDLVALMVADLASEGAAPEPGFIQLLAHLQTAIQAVEAVVAEDG